MKTLNKKKFTVIVDVSILLMSILICTALLQSFKSSALKENSIVKNSMKVEWKVESNFVLITMTAPTPGWVAIGINKGEDLKGTNLIMGAVINGKTEVEDYFISEPGNYLPVKELDGQSHISGLKGRQTTDFTEISFKLKMIATDSLHHRLKEDEEYTLLMAYSTEDDFNHHSRMRTSATIKL